MAQRLRNGVIFLQGHDGEFTSRIFLWSFDKTFKRCELNHQTSPPMMLATPLAVTGGRKVDGSWSGFADDLFTKGVLPDHTADSAKDVILNNAEALDKHIGRGSVQAKNLRNLEIVPSLRRHGEQRRLALLVPFGRFWVEQGTSEADTPSTVATMRTSSADHRRWRRTGRHCQAFGSRARHGVTDG